MNILFILMDDMGWMDLSCYGSGFYETPNLDRLAEESMRFTDAYASCPVCSPTRASIMSGKYPARVGLTNYIRGHEEGILIGSPYTDHLPLEEKSLAAELRDNGYATWHIGKWHMGDRSYWPDRHGFDVNVGGCDWGHPHNGYFSPWGIAGLENGPEGEYLTDRLTDEAVKLIEESGDKPFFLNMCYYAVHTPIQAEQEKIEKYKRKVIKNGLDKVMALEEGEHFPCLHKRDERLVRRLVQSDPVYAAMIESVDENIGRLLKTLKDLGIEDETVVIFTSDNGGLATAEGSPTSNAPLSEGKGWMYEGGTREPLLVKWPGITDPGSICVEPVTSPDFYPTLLQGLGLELRPEQHCDGVSFMPLLRGDGLFRRGPMFWHYPHYGNQGGTPGSSVREGDYKLIEFFEDGRLELYNLREDIGERQNLAGEMPEKAAELREKLARWRKTAGARIPERNPDWSG